MISNYNQSVTADNTPKPVRMFFLCLDGSITDTNEARLEFDKEYER